MSHEFMVIGDIEKARKVVRENGGTFEGSDWSGKFSGRGIEGEYQAAIGTKHYLVTILKKPWYVRYSTIESKIREYFQ